MALLKPDGMFYGERMKMLSDKARLLWPHFMVATNTAGRIEINYRKVLNRAFVDFKANPFKDEAEFLSILGEYQDAYLLFIYESNGQIWGTWDAPKDTWNRFPLKADSEAPAPPDEALESWKKSYRERIQPKPFNLKTFTIPPRKREETRQNVSGIGIGVGIGRGIEEVKAKPTPLRGSIASYAIPSWVPQKEWDGFMEVRAKKRAANTEHALDLLVKELDRLRNKGDPPEQVLQQSIMRSWQSVFPLKGEGNHGGVTSKAQQRSDNTKSAIGRGFGRVFGGSGGECEDGTDGHDNGAISEAPEFLPPGGS